MNAMIQREEEYKDDCKGKQERKTAEEEEEEESSSCQGVGKTSNDLSELYLEEELFFVAGFQNIEMIQQDQEWLDRLEDQWSGQDFDDIFGY